VVITNALCVSDMPPAPATGTRTRTTSRYIFTANTTEIPTADKRFTVRLGSHDRSRGGELASVTAIVVCPGWKWGAGGP
jgi:hypothetical protein